MNTGPVSEPERSAVQDRGIDSGVGELASGAVVGLVSRVAGRAVHLLSQVFVARVLGPAEFGAFALAFTVLRMVGLLTPLGMQNSVLRFGAEARASDAPDRFRGVVAASSLSAAMAGVVAAGAIFASAPWLAESLFGKPEIAPVLRGVSPGIAAMALVRVLAALLRSLRRTAWGIAVEDSLAPVVMVSVWAGFVFAGAPTVVAAAVSTSVGVLAAAAVAVILGLRTLREIGVPAGPIEWPGSAFMRFALASAFAGVFNMYLVWVLRLIIARELPLEQLGLYQAASQSSVLFAVILSAFSAVLGPMVADAVAQGDHQRAGVLYRMSAQWGFVCGAPALVLFFLAPSEILSLVYGVEFSGAGAMLRVLLLGQAVNIATGSVGVLLVLMGFERAWMTVSGLGFLGVVVAGVAVTAPFGVGATAWVESLGLSTVYLGGIVVLVRSGASSPFDGVFVRLVAVSMLVVGGGFLTGIAVGSSGPGLPVAVVCAVLTFAGNAVVMLRNGDPVIRAELAAELGKRLGRRREQ